SLESSSRLSRRSTSKCSRRRRTELRRPWGPSNRDRLPNTRDSAVNFMEGNLAITQTVPSVDPNRTRTPSTAGTEEGSVKPKRSGGHSDSTTKIKTNRKGETFCPAYALHAGRGRSSSRTVSSKEEATLFPDRGPMS